MTTTVPLERINVASPCSASWDEMKGDERARFCRQCQLHVYNLSGMTRSEAERLIEQREGRLCVRLYRRPDGTVITRDCPVGRRTLRRQVALLVGGTAAALSIAGASVLALAGVIAPRQESLATAFSEMVQNVTSWWQPEPEVIMGGTCPAPPANTPPAVPPGSAFPGQSELPEAS